MEDQITKKVRELLEHDYSKEKELVLNILFLKYKMICDIAKMEGKNYRSYNSGFYTGKKQYDTEIKELENYYSIKIDFENPFVHEVIKSLEYDGLMVSHIGSSGGNEYVVKIEVPRAINYLREKYCCDHKEYARTILNEGRLEDQKE